MEEELDEIEATELEVVEEKEETQVTPSIPLSPVSAPVKRYSFEQWAARNAVREQHRGGLRAFVRNIKKHRTLEEWAKCFEGY